MIAMPCNVRLGISHQLFVDVIVIKKILPSDGAIDMDTRAIDGNAMTANEYRGWQCICF
jgi:hypothetical protein